MKRYCLILLILALFLSSCAQPPTEGPTPETIPPPAQTPEIIRPPAETPSPTPTPIPTPTPTPTPAPTLAPQTKPSAPSAATTDAKLGLHTTKANGEQKYIVVLADFPDVKRQYPEETIADRLLGFVSTYFRGASYEQLSLKGDITKPYVLPNPVSYYKISPRNLEVDTSRVLALVKDVVNAADKDVNFSEYTYVVIQLGGTHVEYGMVGLCAIPGMLGFQSKSGITTKSGELISNVAIFCENAHAGTFIHDILHMLGGYEGTQRMTPCLYDHDLQAKYTGGDDWPKVLVNMGYWDPLSSHMPYKRELPPTGLSSWTKMRLNWIDTSKIALVEAGQTTTVILDPLADASASTMVIKIPLTEKTFYLVENRQKIVSDVNCPTTGVLILYADDSVFECRHGKAPVKIMDANPDVPWLEDAAFDVGKNNMFIDSENDLAIILLQKVDLSYRIHITAAEKASVASKSWGIIKEVSSDIDRASIGGGTVGLDEAQQLLGQAAAAFDEGDYTGASNLAEQAKGSLQER